MNPNRNIPISRTVGEDDLLAPSAEPDKFMNQVEAKKRAILQAVAKQADSGATTAANSGLHSHDSVVVIKNPESSGHSDKKKKKKKHEHHHHHGCSESKSKKDKKKKKHKKHKKSSSKRKHHENSNGIINFDTSLGLTNSGLSGKES